MAKYIYNEHYRSQPRRWSGMQVSILLLVLVGLGIFGSLSSTKTTTAQVRKSPGEVSSVSTGQVDAQSLSWNPGIEALDLLRETNVQRLQNNLSPLKLSSILTSSATAKCQDMVLKDYWAHNDPEGREPWHFIDEAGYHKQAAGENLAYGFTDSSGVMAGWMQSPSHRAAILSPLYTDVGFGVCKSQNFIKTGPQTVVVQHFGKPLP